MERWSSRTAFILASVGSAVGMGNIWRFSSVVGQNGGGAYLVPYLTAVFAFALPLMMLELAAGRRLRGDVVTAFGRARPRFRPLGWVVCAVVFSILSYYLVVTGWTLAYVVFSIAGEGVEFADFTSTYRPISYFIVSALMMGAIVSLGIKDGIERATKLLIPFSFPPPFGISGLLLDPGGVWGGEAVPLHPRLLRPRRPPPLGRRLRPGLLLPLRRLRYPPHLRRLPRRGGWNPEFVIDHHRRRPRGGDPRGAGDISCRLHLRPRADGGGGARLLDPPPGLRGDALRRRLCRRLLRPPLLRRHDLGGIDAGG